MLELGHPMHAHDSSRIHGDFAVRFAEPGETVVTLDDIERKLDPGDVLIVDDVATAAIGGVMGAGTTEIDDNSTDILLEAAVWDPAAVSRTLRRLHLVSEAGRRYERSVDPADLGGRTRPLRGAARRDRRRHRRTRGSPTGAGTRRATIGRPPRCGCASTCPTGWPGSSTTRGAAVNRLTQIGARVDDDLDDPAILIVTPPSWRPDLVQPADLVEEVLRLEGLDKIPSVLPTAPAGRGLTPGQKRRRAIGNSLALSGYVEVLPTPFLPAGIFDQWGLAADDPRRDTTAVLNPLEADRPAPGHHAAACTAGSVVPQRLPRIR